MYTHRSLAGELKIIFIEFKHIFEKGKKNLTYYYTPFGSIQIGIDVTVAYKFIVDIKCILYLCPYLVLSLLYLYACGINIAVKKKGAAVKIA